MILQLRTGILDFENKGHTKFQFTFIISRDIIFSGAKGDWDFRISCLVKNPNGTDI